MSHQLLPQSTSDEPTAEDAPMAKEGEELSKSVKDEEGTKSSDLPYGLPAVRELLR